MTRERVFVIWGDSSRAQAHNLDDLYERWMMRRGNPVVETGIFLRTEYPLESNDHMDLAELDFTKPPSIEAARVWQTLLRNRVGSIEGTLSEAKAPTDNGWPMSIGDYERLKGDLVPEMKYLLACSRLIKHFIREWSNVNFEAVRERARMTGDVSTALLVDAYYLLCRHSRSGVEMSEGDQAIMDAMQVRLKNVGMWLDDDSG